MTDTQQSQGQQQQGNQGAEGAEDAGTLRTRFEGQIQEKDTKIDLLEKQVAFAAALPGVDPRSKPVTAMLSQYSGELTTEALLQEASEWNISAPGNQSSTTTQQQQQAGGENGQQQQQAGGPTDEERKAHAQANQLGNDARTPAGGDGPDPVQKGLEDFHTELKGGKTREEAAAAFIDNVMGAAARGDSRVILAGGRRGPAIQEEENRRR